MTLICEAHSITQSTQRKTFSVPPPPRNLHDDTIAQCLQPCIGGCILPTDNCKYVYKFSTVTCTKHCTLLVDKGVVTPTLSTPHHAFPYSPVGGGGRFDVLRPNPSPREVFFPPSGRRPPVLPAVQEQRKPQAPHVQVRLREPRHAAARAAGERGGRPAAFAAVPRAALLGQQYAGRRGWKGAAGCSPRHGD